MSVLERMDPFLTEFDRLTQRAFTQPASWHMPMDVVRHDDSVTVTFDLPGIDPSTLDLTVENDILTVHATRAIDYGDGEKVLVRERPTGQITRRVSLGDWADADNVQASYTNGVLDVHIPVRAQAKPRKIEIQHGSGKELTS
jgi:HSP20 family protein